MSEQPSKTGLITSVAMHGVLLAFILFNFARTPKFDDASESIPVTTVTQTQFNEIMNGEKDAQPVKEPPPEPAHAAPPPPAQPTPPMPPTPPPELKTAEETPPPPPQPAPPPPPQPAPPPPPEPQTPPKPAPPAPSPPPRPLAEDAPPTPAPPPKPVTTAPPTPPAPPVKPVAEAKPAPPVRPKTPPPEKPPEKFRPDQVAKLLEKVKPDEEKPQKAYDPSAISKLIGQNTSKASTETANAAATPQGLPNQHAARMSPSLSAALDAWLTDAYLSCWTPPPTMPDGDRYVAEVRVTFNSDGTLSGQPALINPPTDAAWRPHAESAVRAVLKCNPLHVPPQYLPYFEQWRTKTVHFDPQAALG